MFLPRPEDARASAIVCLFVAGTPSHHGITVGRHRRTGAAGRPRPHLVLGGAVVDGEEEELWEQPSGGPRGGRLPARGE